MNKTTKNIIIRISFLLSLGVFIFLAVLAKISRNQNKVNKILIAVDDQFGNSFVDKKQVLTIVQDKFTTDHQKVSSNELLKIEKSILVIPQVNKANAYTDDNGNLNIKVQQRIPLFRVYNQQGNSFYVDLNGVKFPTSNEFTAKVPIVTGAILESYDTTNTIKSIELKRIFNIIKTINKNTLWSSMIGQYNITPQAQVELIPRLGSSTILLGDDKFIEQKLKRLDIFYFDVLKKVGWDYYKVINIMYKNQIVCLK